MSDPAKGLLAADAPPTWTDHLGRTWQTPRTRNALNASRSAGHRAIRDFVSRRDEYRCGWCGSTSDLDFDHIISRRCGGANHPDNIRLLCGSCNSTKAALVDSKREAVTT